MTDLIPFDFCGSKVRVVAVDNEPWFVAGDACFVLGYSNSRDAVAKHVREHQRGTSRIATPSGEQSVTIINEGGLYRLLMRARTVGPGNKPYANHAKHVTLRPQTRRSPMGERIPAAPQVRVTVEGLAYLHKRLGGTEPLDVRAEDGAA